MHSFGHRIVQSGLIGFPIEKTGSLCFVSRLKAVLLAVFASALVSGPAAAEEWEDHAEVRLIDGGVLPDGVTRLAGLEILLDPEWKTYWRNPGDSGIPPRMDFSASGNVESVKVEWPAPELHFDGYGWVIGYTDVVIFPLLITPKDSAGPAELKLDLNYAVCKDICIPAEAQADILLNGEKPRASEIEFYRTRVPAAVEATGEGGIVATSVKERDGEPLLEVTIRFPRQSDDAFAIVEGPEGWYLPVPKRVENDVAGNAVFEVALGGVSDPATISGANIRVTGVSPDFSFEQVAPLD
jgi:DsbC/DsbD-like thiol-disulfide interchange protein